MGSAHYTGGVATPLFEIDDLHVAIADQAANAADDGPVGAEILKGVDLTVLPGEVHALMGPNGSGKSTLANALLGNPEYVVTQGALRYKGEDITAWDTDVRAKAGMFL